MTGTPHPAPRNRPEGFTLIEIIAALALLAVAFMIGVNLAVSALALGRETESRTAAARVAERVLAEFQQAPQGFEFSALETWTPGAFEPIRPADAEADTELQPAPLPAAMPVDPVYYAREEGLYERFSWALKGRVSAAGAPYAEVTAVVRWEEHGEPKAFTLTTLVRRGALEAAE